MRSSGRLVMALTCTLPILTSVAASSTDSQPETLGAAGGDIPRGRLPETIHPVRYRLTLTIDPDRPYFTGHVEIDAELTRAAEGVWLHGQDLEVSGVRVRGAGGVEHAAAYRQVDFIGVARLTFPDTMEPGPVTLVFDYRAPFNDSLEGLYRVTLDGRNYATTQFEATSARLAFPGFDEPRFKVPFDITLEVPDGATAVTNTPALSREAAGDGLERIHYAETRPLPTYLLAFVVGPWDQREAAAIPASPLRDRPIPLRGVAAAGKGDQLAYALDRTADIVMGLEAYFGTAYPYRKLDIVAVPDFAAGAMENAGAITYREQLLLFAPDASVVRRQRFQQVHAHELAHQWFGDLVTPEWWDDIWLNEAFATWMAAKVMNQLQPGEGYALRQVNAGMAVMKEDALASARQIREPVEKHADIGSAFDGITYQKGAAVLGMLEQFVGTDNFQRGIRNYMRVHAFGNADARDFVRAIAATREDLPDGQVERAFFSFLEQPGTPLVDVDWTCPTDGAVTVSVEQSRYLPVGSDAERDRQWLLPLCIGYGAAGERHEQCELVAGRTASFQLDGAPGCPDYLMPNAGAAGYYRFSLSAGHWRSLLSAPELTDAELLAAAGSLSGAFRAGRLTAGEYVGLVRGLLSSDNTEVVTAPLDDLEWIHDYLLTGENRQRLRTMLSDYYAPVAARVPPEARPDDRDLVQLQSRMARLYALLLESPSWRQALAEQATAYLDGPEGGSSALPANLRQTAFTVAVEEHGKPFADRLLTLLEGSSDAQLRQEILGALSSGGDERLLARLRRMVLSDAVRDNEVPEILEPQVADDDSRDAAWAWLVEHFDAVAARVPYWRRGALVRFASGFCSAERAEDIERRLAPRVRDLGSGPRSLAATVEQIRLCDALVHVQEDAANSSLSAAGRP